MDSNNRPIFYTYIQAIENHSLRPLRCGCNMNVGIWDYCLGYFESQDPKDAQSSSVYKMAWCSQMASYSLKQFRLEQNLMKLYDITMSNNSMIHHCLRIIAPPLVKIITSLSMMRTSSLMISQISWKSLSNKKKYLHNECRSLRNNKSNIILLPTFIENISILREALFRGTFGSCHLIAFFSLENTKISTELYCQFIKAWQLGSTSGKSSSLSYLDEIALAKYNNKDTLMNSKNKCVMILSE